VDAAGRLKVMGKESWPLTGMKIIVHLVCMVLRLLAPPLPVGNNTAGAVTGVILFPSELRLPAWLISPQFLATAAVRHLSSHSSHVGDSV